jgi:hypothetical protein
MCVRHYICLHSLRCLPCPCISIGYVNWVTALVREELPVIKRVGHYSLSITAAKCSLEKSRNRTCTVRPWRHLRLLPLAIIARNLADGRKHFEPVFRHWK